MDERVFTIEDGVMVWLDGESIHIRAVEPHGDPVELSEESALALATILQRLVEKLRHS